MSTEVEPKLIEIARRAGAAILGYYRDGEADITRKDDDSPLTRADTAAHDIITEELGRWDPDTPIISEEGRVAGYEERRRWRRFWLVDPLDGTKEFISQNGEFTVNIALIEAGEPVLGVVYLPALQRTYVGSKQSGSYRIDEQGQTHTLASAPPDLSRPVRVIESRSHAGGDTREKLAGRGVTVGETVPAGSSLKFCRVAEGRADLYPRFGPTMEWDTAAGDAVFRYSGCGAPRPSPLTYNKASLKNGAFIIGLDEELDAEPESQHETGRTGDR